MFGNSRYEFWGKAALYFTKRDYYLRTVIHIATDLAVIQLYHYDRQRK